MTQKLIEAADLFCGAGGTTTGLMNACQELGIKVRLVAVNHWKVAIGTHSANHPGVEHLCEEIDNVDPRKAVPGGRLNLLVASPECIHHSNARGGKPMNDQSRTSGWHILRWAEALYIDNILIENVKEFQYWGPLGANGRPLKQKRGQTFQAFLTALRSLGYNVEYRVLNAANYGDPTTRERLFIIARRGKNKTIKWPEPTHLAKIPNDVFAPSVKPWRTAREIIDWSLPGQSIFTRKRPLAPTTLARITAGLKKFGGANAEPFLMVLRNHAGARSLDKPTPTITAKGNQLALCQLKSFIIANNANNVPRSLDAPLVTVTTGNRHYLCNPYLIRFNGGKSKAGQKRVHDLDKAFPTIGTENQYALIDPFMIAVDHTGRNAIQIRDIDSPVSTITAKGRHGLVEAKSFLVKYYGAGEGVQPVNIPLATITAKDRFGLVQTDTVALDIHFRMLQPHELAGAMSFPKDYKFTGNKTEIVRQIGNAVPVSLAEALCRQLLSDYAPKAKARKSPAKKQRDEQNAKAA